MRRPGQVRRVGEHLFHQQLDEFVLAGDVPVQLARLEKAGKRKELVAITAMGSDRTAWTVQQWAHYAKTVGR
ncbi:hypothetical protein [Streptomyces asoensis]|uniref:Uncharacterized protein n=1 Tax=Streptomyces asoensis TaxID=249586 RepID=A0ABQ3RYF0_9ACTN|nr:hypothetical protein [Streptomyces asoensis]GGQ55348.1 hypothetical protein GCM10010496_18070 [Streptomyces asoensis]GHI60898.1 hypothetical protein Saso_25480 [Streptomyces asoensis]